MKIKFVFWKDNKRLIFDNWQDIVKHCLENDIDKNIYTLCKIIELSDKFKEGIIKSRTALGFPEEGLSFEDYYLKFIDKGRYKNRYVEYYKWRKRICKQIDKNIISNYDLGESIYSDLLVDLIISDYIHASSTSWMDDEYIIIDPYKEELMILIKRNISKNQFIKYLDQHWDQIQKELKHLKPLPTIGISERDIKIVDYRDNEKLPYKDITDRIIDEFNVNDLNLKVNEDSIKTSYFRTKEKIEKVLGRRDTSK